jgi:hypothetical protein
MIALKKINYVSGKKMPLREEKSKPKICSVDELPVYFILIMVSQCLS